MVFGFKSRALRNSSLAAKEAVKTIEWILSTGISSLVVSSRGFLHRKTRNHVSAIHKLAENKSIKSNECPTTIRLKITDTWRRRIRAIAKLVLPLNFGRYRKHE